MRRGVGDAGYSAKLLIENVGEDEVRAGIGGDEFDAGVVKRHAERLRATRIILNVAVEELDALIAGRGDLGDRPADVAVGHIGELADRGDADRVAAQRPPAIGLVGEANLHGRFSLRLVRLGPPVVAGLRPVLAVARMRTGPFKVNLIGARASERWGK